MDWIVTTARTVDEAQTRALDLLGVDAADAEIQIVEEGKTGLFGRTKTEARVRARIKPKAPPVKEERRGRNDRNRNRSQNHGKNSGKGKSQGGGRQGNRQGQGGNQDNRGGKNQGDGRGGQGSQKQGGNRQGGKNQRSGDGQGGGNNQGNSSGSRNRRRRSRGGAAAGAAAAGAAGGRRNDRDNADRPEMPIEEQRETLEAFVLGVAQQFDSSSTVELEEVETTLTAHVHGDDLGRLLGPKAAVLQSLEELSRTAMHRAADGRRYHRIRVDVDSYRARRREALERFARQTAERVQDSGQAVAMEPMGAADRKVVHDVVNDMEGVESGSEGRDPRRYIVISPVGGSTAADEEE